MALFLDTSFVIALEMARDNQHAPAKQYWAQFSLKPQMLVTSDAVFSEIVTFFNARGLHAKAVEIGDRLLASQWVDMVSIDADLRNESWGYFKRHGDKSYSLTDCSSFVLMRKRRITKALSFDAHFSQAGFELPAVLG